MDTTTRKGLKILSDRSGTPKFVVENGKQASAMSVVVAGSDTVEWTQKKAREFRIEFVDSSGAPTASPFQDWGTDSSRTSTNGTLTGTISADPPDVVYKYNVVDVLTGKKLDPQIIIDN